MDVAKAPVRVADDRKSTITLFTDYMTWLGRDLSFQDFANEMASMRSKYAPPTGELLLAESAFHAPIGMLHCEHRQTIQPRSAK